MAAKVKGDRAQLMQDYNLTEKCLKKKCSNSDIIEIGTFISWKNVGPHLPNITRQNIKDIDKDGHDQNDKRCCLLDMWEKINGDDATYDVMITAMLKARKKAEATEVCALLQAGDRDESNKDSPSRLEVKPGPGNTTTHVTSTDCVIDAATTSIPEGIPPNKTPSEPTEHSPITELPETHPYKTESQENLTPSRRSKHPQARRQRAWVYLLCCSCIRGQHERETHDIITHNESETRFENMHGRILADGPPSLDSNSKSKNLDINRDVGKVAELLKNLTRDELKQLFSELGLFNATVMNKYEQSVSVYADDLIRAWMMGRDDVLSKTDYPGGATWENLKKALEKLNHHGIARQI